MNEQVQKLLDWYGDGSDGSCPTPEQWSRILDRPVDRPITLINFFKLREKAHYDTPENTSANNASADPGADASASGMDAFNSYASVSMPTMERVGGTFLHAGPYVGTFLGDDENWDIVAIGAYPNLDAFLGLYTDAGYRTAFAHRVAACERQKVMICASAP